MADLDQGTRQRNLRQLSGGAAVPSGNTRSMSSGGPPAPSTDWIQALGGRIGGWCIENGKLTADGGNVKLNSFVPSISLGAATDYITGTGFWVGKNSAVYKLHLGDPAANHLKWDGSTLTVVGTISATAGAIGGWTIGANSISADGGAAVIDSSVPKITLGAASDYLTGAGFFVGKSGGAYKWHIGDPAADYIGWSGSTLVAGGNWITGSAVNFLNIPVLNGATWTNNSPSAGYVAWNSFTLTYQGTSYTITAGNTNDKYVWWNKATSTTVLQHSNTAPDGAVDQFLVCLNSTGTALPALFQNVIYADHIKATQLSAIAADLGSITAGTITGGLIRTAASGARVQMDGTYLAGYGTDGVTKQFYLNASDGKAYAGGGTITLDSEAIKISASGANLIKAVDASGYEILSIGAGGGNVSIVANLNYHSASGSIYLAAHASSSAAQTRFDLWCDNTASYAWLAGNAFRALQGLTVGLNATPNAMLDVRGDGIFTGGLNVGTATGAGTGDIKASGNVTITGTLTVGGSAIIAHTTAEGSLGADVAIAGANTYYNGPSVTLGAGTWFVTGHVSVTDSAANLFTAKLWDGTNVKSSGEIRVDGSNPMWGVIALEGIFVLTGSTAVKISVAAVNASGAIKAACAHNGAGNNASHIQAVKIA